MGIVYTRTKALIANSVNVIAHTQTPAGAGNLTLVSTPVTLDSQRQVLFTPAGAEATNGTIWVVYGINSSGSNIQETVDGADNPATANTIQSFLAVSQISVNKAQAGAVQVGTNTVGATAWQSIDMMRQPINVGFAVTITGTVNYTIQITNQDVNALSAGQVPTTADLAGFTALAYSTSGGFTTPAAYFRVQINSGTGTITLNYQQAGP